jgi:hypothetical protein
MVLNPKDGGFNFRQLSQTERDRATIASLVDIELAMYALLINKGLITPEDTQRMVKIVRGARAKLGNSFTFDEGLKAILATFRIETGGGPTP